MLRIATPLALAELGWMAMGLVDTVMAGGLPNSALAIGATSVGSAVFYGFGIFGLGLLMGLDTLVSQAFGAGDRPEAHRTLGSAIVIALAGSPLLMLCVFAISPALGLIGVTNEVRQEAGVFTNVLVWSLPPLMLYSAFRRYLQGMHVVKPITFALITANLVNALGNWMLIYGNWGFPAMGIRGSALATVIARLYMCAVLYWSICRHDPSAFRKMSSDLAHIKRILVLSLPAALQIGFEVGVFNAATALAGTLDPASLAAHAIALNAASITYMVPLGISSAAAVMVGKAVGAGDFAEAKQAGWTALWIAVAFEICSAAAFLLFPNAIAGIYTHDARVISFSVTLLAIAAVFQLFDGLQVVATGALRGLGSTRTAMVYNLIGYWVIGLPLGIWLCFGLRWGAVGLWDGLALALILIGVGLLLVWRKQVAKIL